MERSLTYWTGQNLEMSKTGTRKICLSRAGTRNQGSVRVKEALRKMRYRTHRLRIMDGSRMDPADRHQWTAAQIRILMLVPIQRHGRKISQKDSRHHRYSGPPRDRINHTRA